MGNLEQLREELNLDEQQTAQFEQLMAEMREQMRAGRENNEQIRELVQQLREAREAGDEAKAEQLRAQLAELGGGRRGMDTFYDKLNEILRPDQQQALARFRERGPGGDQQGGDVRTMVRAARNLELTAEQREALRSIEEEIQQATREAREAGRGDREQARQAEAQLAEEIKKKIMAMLTPEQQQEFEQQLSQRQRRGGRER
jgi:Spy/CpxP family protein refolding chaperone